MPFVACEVERQRLESARSAFWAIATSNLNFRSWPGPTNCGMVAIPLPHAAKGCIPVIRGQDARFRGATGPSLANAVSRPIFADPTPLRSLARFGSHGSVLPIADFYCRLENSPPRILLAR